MTTGRRGYARGGAYGWSFAGERSRASAATGAAPGAPLETPMAGLQPIQQRGLSCLEATPAFTRTGTAAKSFMRRNAENRSDSTHLAAITTGPAMSDLRELRLYTKEILLDIVHETYGADSSIEYASATTTIQIFGRRRMRKKSQTVLKKQ